jgi:putative nucleotidyltransferase with HDIG domain
MRVNLLERLRPPSSSVFGQAQKAKLLHWMLFATLLGAVFFALQNLKWNDIPSALAFLLLVVACLLGLGLNHGQRFYAAAAIFCVCALAVIDYALYAGGSGLHDPGVIAYPMLILCAALLFGARGLVTATLASIASVAVLYLLEVNGFSSSLYPSSPTRVLGLGILFTIMAVVTAAVRDTWETNLLKLNESYDLTLQGWARALEYRDGETEGHSRRVTELCVALARKLACSEDEIVQIRRGAYLHDIGKMALPGAILFKAGPLNAEEWDVMKQHPVLGFKLVSEIPFLQDATSIPYSHHERWDGTGYPQGLQGEEIPLAARIFAGVDHWDALCSDHPYRKA